MNDEPTNSIESYHRVIDILFSGVTHESAWEMLRVIAKEVPEVFVRVAKEINHSRDNNVRSFKKITYPNGVSISGELMDKVVDLLDHGQIIPAIREIRAESGASLEKAKDFVAAYRGDKTGFITKYGHVEFAHYSAIRPILRDSLLQDGYVTLNAITAAESGIDVYAAIGGGTF